MLGKVRVAHIPLPSEELCLRLFRVDAARRATVAPYGSAGLKKAQICKRRRLL